MKTSTLLTTVVLTLLASASPTHATDDVKRRQALKAYAVQAFGKSSNHCRTFADVTSQAAKTAPDVGTWFEDLRLVLVGEDWLRRKSKRGSLYVGPVTNDSGFKRELRDGSPQVEHAYAAIFLGKAAPPGASSLAGSFIELVTGGDPTTKVGAADHTLYAYGSDIGARVSKFNLESVPEAIRRTLCE